MGYRFKYISLFSLTTCFFLLSGCALHYYDESTGKNHVLGLGLISYRTSQQEGLVGVVTQNRTLGISAGVDAQEGWVSVGIDSRTKLEVSDDSCLRLEWPTASLTNIRIGAKPPDDFPQLDCPKHEQ